MKNCQKGFGLTEVMVTAGILSGLALGVASVLTDAAKGQKGVNEAQSVQELVNTIHLVLNRSNACQYTFIGAPNESDFKNNKSVHLTELKIPTSSAGGVLIAKANDKIPGMTSLEVPAGGITLTNLGKPVGSDGKEVSEPIYIAELGVQIHKAAPGRAPLSSMGVASYDRKFKTLLKFNSSGELEECGQLPSIPSASGTVATNTGTGTGTGTDTGTGAATVTDTGTGTGTGTDTGTGAATVTDTGTGTGTGTGTPPSFTTSRTCTEQTGKYVASMTSDGTCQYHDLPTAQSLCPNLGGNWNGSRCVMPGNENKIVSGLAHISNTSRGTGSSWVDFPSDAGFSNEPQVFISPRWIRFTGDEDVSWAVTEVTSKGFKIEWHGPNSDGTTIGQNKVAWVAIEKK